MRRIDINQGARCGLVSIIFGDSQDVWVLAAPQTGVQPLDSESRELILLSIGHNATEEVGDWARAFPGISESSRIPKSPVF